ncbi:MAG: replication-associated recombination protein A [Cellvibrionales bacterium TMED47]|nr:recombination factor protein RarA [Porticoccaceae bacterium]RPG85229.1 MAG: replication-associated recombination protein A [Cellvibrionales bacterium TMED47]
MSTDLFTQEVYQPLASKRRPQSLSDFLGQQHILSQGKPLRETINSGLPHSMILWGPPGVGKTTLAKIIAQSADAHFESISAVLSGVKEIRAAISIAQQQRDAHGRKTLLFVDEVHRFNKSQQDAFLPYVEDGTVIFIGATTENPSFELNNALLSRCRIYVLKGLTLDDIKNIVTHSLPELNANNNSTLTIEEKALELLANAADGDARRALNLLEIAADLVPDDSSVLNSDILQQVLVGDNRRFDNKGEYFYDQISALHKSIRGSDPDASLYWLCRMLDGGCDPLYIARRLVRIASEDIGNADPRALEITLNAWNAQERLGSPEGELSLAQAVVYLAIAAKSNAVYTAYKAVMADIRSMPSCEVPIHLRNAPTKLMKQLDYGKDYRYAHNEEGGYAAAERYLPEELKDKQYYFPTDRGLEVKIAEKLTYLRSLDKKMKSEK